VRKELSRDALAFNAHSWGLAPADFEMSELLTENFKVLSTSFDGNNSEFVSIIEAKNNPVFAVQFHPEKSMFEWSPFLAINHSQEAVGVMQYFADFLVDQARMSSSRMFASEQEADQHLIYNYAPVFNDTIAYFPQTYFFVDPSP